MIHHGDCLEVMRTMPDNSVDAVVTDPPYALNFMGKKWDTDVPSVAVWTEVLRILKPGGHVLSFGGTRTYHRMVVNIEDAGFEIRDQLQWIFGSGFPKSHDVSKGIDKMHGAEREVVGRSHDKKYSPDGVTSGASIGGVQGGHNYRSEFDLTDPATPEAIQWQGWGTALKPANEPIVLARKPLSESTVAKNVLKWGCGALNIDASRIAGPIQQVPQPKIPDGDLLARSKNYQGRNGKLSRADGRWPANVLFDEEAAKLLDEQSIAGGIHSAGKARPKQNHVGDFGIGEHGDRMRLADHRFDDKSIGASRFFYCAKASKSERNKGLENEVMAKQGARPGSPDASGKFPDHDHRSTLGNSHPTVKPIKLMEYLCRLISPPGGTVLDPFLGSGTTGVACKNLKLNFIGIEMNKEYVEIAEKRIGSISNQELQLEFA